MARYDTAQLADFAYYYGFHHRICNPEILVKDFMLDMKRGLCGKASSLQMIPAYLQPETQSASGKKVLALDAGGTNLRAALVSFDEAGAVRTEHVQKAVMPGTQGRVGVHEFFDQIAAVTVPILEAEKNIAGIGFCFSYPMELTSGMDGILLSFSKEIDAPDVIGKAIGQGLREALSRRGVSYKGNIVLLNDTAAALLCGLMSIKAAHGIEGEDRRGAAGAPVIGFILGTGFNTAYPEGNIPKINFYSPDKPQIVVAESGNFNFRYRGKLDIEYDKTTKNPNKYPTEKATAGAYLGPLSLYILKQAVRDGVLKFRRQDALLSWETLQTKDLNAFMRNPLSKEGDVSALFDDDEGEALSSFVYLVSMITRRGGIVAASVLAGTVRHIVECSDFFPEPFAPVRIAVEGTTFLIYKGMRQALEVSLYSMLQNSRDRPIPYCIEPVESASLNGAAVAALCKSGAL